MTIRLKRASGVFHMVASNQVGHSIETDANEEIGGTNKGARPMEIMLMSMGACSSIDVIQILRKQRQSLEDIEIILEGTRTSDKLPSLFTEVHIHFKLIGEIDEKKAERAISLSVEKYCSVAETLRRAGAHITYTFEVEKN